MKKYIALFFAVALCAGGMFSTHLLRADAQGGNTAAAAVDEPKGVTLNTKYTPDATARNVLQTNLGIGQPGGGLLIPSGTPTTPAAGTVVLTSTSVKIYLAPTTGLIIQSGTVTTF